MSSAGSCLHCHSHQGSALLELTKTKAGLGGGKENMRIDSVLQLLSISDRRRGGQIAPRQRESRVGDGCLQSPHQGAPHKGHAELQRVGRHVTEVFSFPFICKLAARAYEIRLGAIRGTATSSPCSFTNMPAGVMAGMLWAVRSSSRSQPHNGAWGVLVHGVMLLAVRGASTHHLVELCPVFLGQLADFSLNGHSVLAWLSNEHGKIWEMGVDLQTAGDLA